MKGIDPDPTTWRLTTRAGTPPPRRPRRIFLLATAASAQDIVDVVADNWLTFVDQGDTLRLPYYASHDLATAQPGLVRVVIVVHGTLRNADSYFEVMQDAAGLAGAAGDSTLIIAPQFLTDDDVEHFELGPQALCWLYDGWRQGDQSVSGSHGGLSSFAVADSLLMLATQVCPDLREAVITGHSAGGQFANRYAASSPLPDRLREDFGVHFRSVVANPSTYVYFSSERWVRGTAYEFATPSAGQIDDCPTWDDYKYGLQNPNPYFTLPADTVRARYARRHVVHLLGQEDVNPYDVYLDRTCPAMMQGDYRLERGVVYWNYLQYTLGDQLGAQQAIAVVPWAGHHHYEMYPSACGLYHVFDVGSCEEPVFEPSFVESPLAVVPTYGSHAVAWADYDGDGRDDLLIAGDVGAQHLLRNLGAGKFVDDTPAIVNDAGYVISPAWGDFDGDGLPDLALACLDGPGLLALNEVGGAFADVTPAELQSPSPATAADWADYDGDGDLDLFVGRGDDAGDLLLRNDGSLTFTDASADLGLLPGDTRGATWADLDNDRDPELVLARNDRLVLLRNDGGLMVDVSDSLPNITRSFSSVAAGDYDNDGDLDLYAATRQGGNVLLRNAGKLDFRNATGGPAGSTRNTRAATFADHDNDGWLDLYLANVQSADQLLRGTGGGNFTDATRPPLGAAGASYSAAWADADLDGDLDLYVGVHEGDDLFYLNQATHGHHWLQVDLHQWGPNPAAVGAHIRCRAGSLRQLREVGTDEAYMSQGSLTAEFGLGAAVTVDTLEVRWLDGGVTILTDVAADSRLLVERADTTGGGNPHVVPQAAYGLLPPWPNPCNPIANLAFDLRGPATVSLRLYDLAGRRVRTLLAAQRMSAGRHTLTWDGRDDHGRTVAAGVYQACLTGAGGAPSVRSLTLVK